MYYSQKNTDELKDRQNRIAERLVKLDHQLMDQEDQKVRQNIESLILKLNKDFDTIAVILTRRADRS